jgi:hypothetical protein
MSIRTVSSLIIFLLLPIAQSSAEQVYTWVDENGTTHFSEAPPNNEAISAEQINLQPAPSAGRIVGDGFYSVANQADRMERTRLENEKLIAERLQAEAEAGKASAEARAAQQNSYQQNTQDDARYYSAYPYYSNNRRRPGYGNKPHLGKPGKPGNLPARRPMSSLGGRAR